MFGLDDLAGAVDDVFTLGQGGKGTDYALQGRKAFEDLKPIGPSAYEGADPSTRSAQLDALSQLQDSYRQGGLNAIDRGRLGDIQQGVAQSAQTAQAGVAQDAMRRGLYNSGNALVNAQVGGQGAAMLGAQQGRDAASLAQQTRMGAIAGAGVMAGGVRDQDYQKAAAQDAISKFNANNALARAQGLAGVYNNAATQANNSANRGFDETGRVLKMIPGLGKLG